MKVPYDLQEAWIIREELSCDELASQMCIRDSRNTAPVICFVNGNSFFVIKSLPLCTKTNSISINTDCMHFPVNVLVNKTKVQDGYKTYRVEDFIFIILTL